MDKLIDKYLALPRRQERGTARFDAQVSTRLGELEYQEIQILARDRFVSVSEYLRAVVMATIDKLGVDYIMQAAERQAQRAQQLRQAAANLHPPDTTPAPPPPASEA